VNGDQQTEMWRSGETTPFQIKREHVGRGVRHFPILLAMLCALCFAANGAESTNRLFVTGRIEGGVRHKFWADWAQLPSRVAWEPGVQTFPADLSGEWDRVQSHIIAAKGTTDRLALTWIFIERLFVPERQMRLHGLSPEDMANQWYVGFCWTNRNRGTGQLAHLSGSAVVLLDGTLLQEEVKVRNSSEDQIGKNMGKSGSGIPGQEKSSSAGGTEATGWTDHQILKPRISTIRWEPDSEKFPMDLSDAFRLAKRHADQSVSGIHDLRLSKIWIVEYFPPQVLLAGNQSRKGHWRVSFFFSSSTRPRDNACIVEMLLDSQVNVVFRDRRLPMAE